MFQLSGLYWYLGMKQVMAAMASARALPASSVMASGHAALHGSPGLVEDMYYMAASINRGVHLLGVQYIYIYTYVYTYMRDPYFGSRLGPLSFGNSDMPTCRSTV